MILAYNGNASCMSESSHNEILLQLVTVLCCACDYNVIAVTNDANAWMFSGP